MGHKNLLNGAIIFNGQDASVSFDSKSNPINTSLFDATGIQVSWTGNPVGILKVFVSNDQTKPSKWSLLDFGAPIPVDATNSDLIIEINSRFSWIALDYTATSGTGTLTAKLTAKEYGG